MKSLEQWFEVVQEINWTISIRYHLNYSLWLVGGARQLHFITYTYENIRDHWANCVIMDYIEIVWLGKKTNISINRWIILHILPMFQHFRMKAISRLQLVFKLQLIRMSHRKWPPIVCEYPVSNYFQPVRKRHKSLAQANKNIIQCA